MRQEIAKQTKTREAIQKKLHQMEDQKADIDVQRETLKAQITGLEKGIVSKTHTCTALMTELPLCFSLTAALCQSHTKNVM